MPLDQQFVENVVKAIVNKPEAVKTVRKTDEMGVLITVSVAPEDLGKVIGRNGQTAMAIRTLLRVVGVKLNARSTLKITDPRVEHPPQSIDEECSRIYRDGFKTSNEMDEALSDI